MATLGHVGFRAWTKVRRPSRDLIDQLATYAPPDLADAMRGAGAMDTGIRPLYRPMRKIAGPAITVSVPYGTLSIVKLGMQQTQSGDIIVINAKGTTTSALWGGNMSRAMRRRGLGGVVLDGAARDPSESREVDFPVFCRAMAVNPPASDGPGEVNVPVACGGVVVFPGDIIIGDESGIVVVPSREAQSILDEVIALKAKRASLNEVLERGEVTNIETITNSLLRQGYVIHDGESALSEAPPYVT